MCGPSRWMVTVQRRVWPSQTCSRMSLTNSRSRPGLPRALVLRGRGSLPLSLRTEVSPIRLTQMLIWMKNVAYALTKAKRMPCGTFCQLIKVSWCALFLFIFGMTSVSCFEIPFYHLDYTMSVPWTAPRRPLYCIFFIHLLEKLPREHLESPSGRLALFPPNIDMFPLKLPTDKTLL